MVARFFSRPWAVAVLLWSFLGAVAYLSVNLVVMPYFAGKFTGMVQVPALTRLPPEKARDILVHQGLLYMLDSTGDFSNEVGAGQILSQYPVSGTEVKKGRRIWVRISKGPRSVALPPLRGLSIRQAEITLQQLGLRMGRIREIGHSAVPAGAVIGTSPAANTTLEMGQAVNVDISLGKDAAAPEGVPALTGLTLVEARDRLLKSGLQPGKITQTRDPHQLPNTVLSQNPVSGTPRHGQAVDLVVAK